MGGGVIIIAVLLGYTAAHLFTLTPPSTSGLLVLDLMTGLGVVGFIDDYIKIRKQRSLGLSTGPSWVGRWWSRSRSPCWRCVPGRVGLTPASDMLSFIRDTGSPLPAAVLRRLLRTSWSPRPRTA